MSKLFCIHDYRIIDKEVFECKLDRAKKLGLTPTSGFNIGWLEKTMVITFECVKCGKIKIKKTQV